jgi:hypothetical protein
MKRLACTLPFVVLLIVTLSFTLTVVEAQDTQDPYATPEAPFEFNWPTPEPTATPLPTPTPTPKIVPGSPLSVGSSTLEELLFQLDILGVAQVVMVGLGLMWFFIISVTVAKKLFDKMTKEKDDA